MKNKVTLKDFEFAVRKAKQFVSNYDKARWIICNLALEVCEISEGGRVAESTFTISKFAEEIEIDRKTLYQWIRVKKLVFDKLPKNIQEKSHKYKYDDFLSVCDQVDKSTLPKQVKALFDAQLEINPTHRKFNKYLKHMSSILFNCQRPLLMKDIDLDVVEKMKNTAGTIHNLLQKEIELRGRYPDPISQDKKRLNMKDEVADRISK